jgi:mannan endo-1,4-beta-mannosidase
LRAIDDKPILLSEIGCTETGGNKPAWIRSLFEALPKQPDIIGFSWFNQTVTAIPIGQKVPVCNDWRIDSTPRALAAFREGIADPRVRLREARLTYTVSDRDAAPASNCRQIGLAGQAGSPT